MYSQPRILDPTRFTMSGPAQAIRAYIVGSFQELPPSIVDDIANGSVSLLGVVRLLGEYLTSEEEDTRTRAVQLLSEITCHFLEPTSPPPDKRAPSPAYSPSKPSEHYPPSSPTRSQMA